jgi:LysR family hca operon transcriptional activator
MLPASIEGYLPGSMTSRPLAGQQPTVDLVLGYHKANASLLLKTFLSKIDDLACRIYKARAER